MVDLVEVLRGLRVGPGSSPEPVERLRERIAARRRRHHRSLVGGLALAVAAAATLFVVVDDEGGSTVHTVDDSTSVPATIESGSRARLPVGSVVSSAAGIEQVAASGELVRLSGQPTARAFAINNLVVAQGAEVGDAPLRTQGPVLILEAGAQRALPAEPDEELVLHDVGVVETRAVAVVTATRGIGPDDTDERLLLVDLETGERTDLGSVGGWESGVRQARLSGGLIVTLATASIEQRVVVRSLDGAVVWEASEAVIDGNVTLAVDGDQVLQLEPTYVGDDFDPQLNVTRYELSSGAEISTEPLALKPASGLKIEAGFCFTAEASAGRMLCDQADGAPVQVDLHTGETTALAGLDQGVPTLPREPLTGSTDPETTTDPPKIADADAQAAEGVVTAFLEDLRRGDLAAAAARWTGYPELPPSAVPAEKSPFIEQLLADPAIMRILGTPTEAFVTASWGGTTATPVVTVLAPRNGDDPPVAVAFLTGFSEEHGDPDRMWIHRLPLADASTEPDVPGAFAQPGQQIVIPGVPVEGGARAYINGREIPIEIDQRNLTMTITIPTDARGDVAVTISTATPELPGAQAFALTIGVD